MIWANSGTNPGVMLLAIAFVLSLLALFGFTYNFLLAEYRAKNNWEELYTPLAIGIYLIGTLAGAAFVVGIQIAFIVTLCFVASGAPFIIGSLSRYAQQQKQLNEFLKNLKTGKTTKRKETTNHGYPTKTAAPARKQRQRSN